MTVNILGIPFFKGSTCEVFEKLKLSGGLLTVPAAPALVNIPKDNKYYEALLSSDVSIPDSGYMVLIWNLIDKNKLNKISGLAFINYFITQLNTIEGHEIFLINPSDEEGFINKQFFRDKNIVVPDEGLYTAPYYKDNVKDELLTSMIERQQPRWILINIGGGTQEKLGSYLKESLSYKPAILCTGAAIAFKTGSQVNIPKIIDKLYLGWLFRCISQPKLYIPRYLKGFKLYYLILKYKSNKVK